MRAPHRTNLYTRTHRDTLRVKKLLSMFLKLDSDNYPETLGVMAIVNAPDWFARAFG